MTQNELTKAIFWQLIAFAKLEEDPQNEFSTFPVLFEFAKTQGIQNTISIFKTLEKYNFLSSKSSSFQTISLTQKAISLKQKEDIKDKINKNNWAIFLAKEEKKHQVVEELRNENELLKILIT